MRLLFLNNFKVLVLKIKKKSNIFFIKNTSYLALKYHQH